MSTRDEPDETIIPDTNNNGAVGRREHRDENHNGTHSSSFAQDSKKRDDVSGIASEVQDGMK